LDIITSIISVFIASIIELWLGIPIGLFLNINPVLIVIVAAAGSILSAFLIINLGEGLRKRFLRWRYGEKSPEDGRIFDIWNKYGIIGLGLLSPLLFGAPLGAALGIGLGAPKDRLLFWMTVGIVIWTIILTAAGYFGLISFKSFNK
jgi:hypothetical protein